MSTNTNTSSTVATDGGYGASGSAVREVNDERALSAITFVGAVIAGCCFTIVLILHALGAPRPLPLQKRVLIHMVGGYLTTLIVYVTAILYGQRGSDDATCAGIGAALHYTLLSAFCWMFAEGLALHRTFVVVFLDRASDTRCLYQYAAFAYGAPALVVTGSLVLWSSEFGSRQGTGMCWLRAWHDGATLALIVPAATLCVANCALLVNLLRHMTASVEPTTSNYRVNLRVSIVFSGCCGLDWLILLPMMSTEGDAHTTFAYVFSVCNVLCGVMIFAWHGGLDAGLWRHSIAWGGEMLRNQCIHGDNIVSHDGHSTRKLRRTNIMSVVLPDGSTKVVNNLLLDRSTSAPWRRRAGAPCGDSETVTASSTDDVELGQPDPLASAVGVKTSEPTGSTPLAIDTPAAVEPNPARPAPPQLGSTPRLGTSCRTSTV
jgi:hypothetical protein